MSKYNSKCRLDCNINGCGIHLCQRYADYEQGRTDALANKVNLIEDSNFNPNMFKNCCDVAHDCGYQQGVRDFAEWLQEKSIDNTIALNYGKFKNMDIDEVLAKWQEEKAKCQEKN